MEVRRERGKEWEAKQTDREKKMIGKRDRNTEIDNETLRKWDNKVKEARKDFSRVKVLPSWHLMRAKDSRPRHCHCCDLLLRSLCFSLYVFNQFFFICPLMISLLQLDSLRRYYFASLKRSASRLSNTEVWLTISSIFLPIWNHHAVQQASPCLDRKIWTLSILFSLIRL